ncbi:thymidine kinase [Paracrocinitomix mangrovi]|uniref:thymidine kinase n=1 Tax=Paracrocinitomix mangrovi TaxID=2862509 RepID=UPI0021078FB4|nr:thymidine kinase [Paracrocinitomix mangrovi]
MNTSQKNDVKISRRTTFSPRVKNARIQLICGPMFSGKTTALISQVQQLRNEGKDVFVFKPQLDNRYADKSVVSHDKNKVEAFAIDKSVQILDYHLNADVVAVDEVQFFDDKIVEVLQKVANDGKDVIAAGLDMDYLGRPFGAIPALLTVADDVKKLNSVCTFCSGKARFSHRISQDNGTVVLGEKDKYVPLCRSCYNELKDQ